MELPAKLGKYELQQCLGGGMSLVYRAVDTMIGRTVAVKILRAEAAEDQDARERFLDEARTAAKSSHENVISIYDFGIDPQWGYFMVMEFLEGEDLRSAIRNKRTGDLRSQVKIALQAGRALDFIHRNRIIHRDVKPENLYLSRTGVVKLMDFGIAKLEDHSRTQAGFALGTPYYMAPEQVRGEKLSAQADVYAFGIVLYELFTAQRPIVSETVEGIFSQILHAPVRMEPLQQAGVPQELVKVIEQCTAKDPAARPQGMGPVIQSLDRFLNGPAAAPKPSEEVTEVLPVRGKSPATMLYAGIGAAVVLAAIVAYFVLKPAPPVAPPPKMPELARSIETSTGTMLLVPAGEFQMGEDKHRATLPDFYIDRTEVTNAAFQKFSQSTGQGLPPKFDEAHPDYPVVNVTWSEARDFALWAGKRLPTAAEWEKAARGTDGRVYTWGNEKDTSRANLGNNDPKSLHLKPVTDYVSGASPVGALQMIGNAWEMVADVRDPPEKDKSNSKPGETWYMIRGISGGESLTAGVLWDSYAIREGERKLSVGFRCAKNPAPADRINK